MKRTRSWPLLITKDQDTQTELSGHVNNSCRESVVTFYRRLFKAKKLSGKVNPKQLTEGEESEKPPSVPKLGWVSFEGKIQTKNGDVEDFLGASLESLRSS